MLSRRVFDLVPLLLTAFIFLVLGWYLGMTGTIPVGISSRGAPRYSQVDTITQGKLLQCTLHRMKDEKLEHDDPELVQYAREQLLIPPDYKLPYNLTTNSNPDHDGTQYGQLKAVRDIFDNVIKTPSEKGFFIEVGAHNGEYLSNTLWLERNWGWTGLLIEADRSMFEVLKSRNRKAWLANVCLSPSIHPGKFTYYMHTNNTEASGTGLREITYLGDKKPTSLYCAPLYTLLLAINQTEIDYWSLDIEGAELDILLTVPFDRLHFKVISIETTWIPGGNGAARVKQLLNRFGYKLYEIRDEDSIYVHSQYLPHDFVETTV